MPRSLQMKKHDTTGHAREGRHDLWRGYSLPQAIKAVKSGLSYRVLLSLHKSTNISLDQLARQVEIPPRTLARRKIEGRFRQDESERLLRFAGLFEKACDLFEGDVEATKEWLARPNHALGGETPADYAKTEIGAREVENLIGRLEYGVFS